MIIFQYFGFDANITYVLIKIHYLVKDAGKGANLLMNIGHQPNGEMPAKAIERLKEIVKWMNVFRRAITVSL